MQCVFFWAAGWIMAAAANIFIYSFVYVLSAHTININGEKSFVDWSDFINGEENALFECLGFWGACGTRWHPHTTEQKSAGLLYSNSFKNALPDSTMVVLECNILSLLAEKRIIKPIWAVLRQGHRQFAKKVANYCFRAQTLAGLGSNIIKFSHRIYDYII